MAAAMPAMAAEPSTRPGRITGTDLKEYPTLTGTRKKIVDEALALRGPTAQSRSLGHLTGVITTTCVTFHPFMPRRWTVV